MRARYALRRWLGAATVIVGVGASALAQTQVQTAPPLQQPRQTLAELEQAARVHASGVRIADEDARRQAYRLEAVEAQRGATLNASVGLADTREPVTDTEVRSYRRGSAQVGVRWPLLEGAQVQERAQTDARGALEIARLRSRQAEIDAVRDLRLAYIDHAHARERVALADAILTLEPAIAPVLQARTRDALLLEADRRDLATIFDLARRDRERARASGDDARRRIASLSGMPQVDPAAEPPRWDTRCIASAPLLAGADARPAVALASIALATREAMAIQQDWTGVDAGVSLTQSLSRDIGSLSGRSTGVGVDVSVPLGWRSLRAARKAEAESDVRRARLELDAARDADAASVDQIVRGLSVRDAERSAALQRLDASLEALRVAELRLRRLEGDVIEKVLRARHAVYLTALEVSDSLQLLERAQADALALAAPCSAAGAPIEPAQWAALPAMLARPIVESSPGATAGEGAGNAVATRLAPGLAPGLGWYVWKAAPWLASPAASLARLPPSSERVLLGVDAAQLRAFTTPAGAAALRDLIAQAHARRVRVELLLGDPQWVLPHGRDRLLAMLRPIAGLPFDGINLDLERDQLPRKQRKLWAPGVVATVAAVHRAVSWPIGLSTHDRDLRDPRTNGRLRAAGASELVALIYTTQRERAEQRVRAVLEAAPGLRVSIGQSVERVLPAESSLHGRGRALALAQAGALARELAQAPATPSRFGGVVIQSFEEFQSAQP